MGEANQKTTNVKIWENIITILKTKEIRGETYLPRPDLIDVKGDRIEVHQPHNFYRGMLVEKYGDVIQQAVAESLGHPGKITYLVSPERFPIVPRQTPPEPQKRQINPRLADALRATKSYYPHTFESLIEHSGNAQALAASREIVEHVKERKSFGELLCIYGGSGSGKTAMLAAIINELRSQEKATTFTDVHLLSAALAEAYRAKKTLPGIPFVEGITSAAMVDSTEGFYNSHYQRKGCQERARSLVDLCQLNGVPTIFSFMGSQEELNKLIERIRTPDQEGNSNPALAGRLERMTKIGIHPPRQDEIPRILTQLISEQDTTPETPEEIERVAHYLASMLPPRTSFGKIVADLNTVSARAAYEQTPMTRLMAAQALGYQPPLLDEIATRNTPLTPEAILTRFSELVGVSVLDLQGNARDNTTAQARHKAVHLLHTLGKLNQTAISKTLGGRHPSTANHSLDIVRNSPQMQKELEQILKEF